MINPAVSASDPRYVVQSTSRVLKEQVTFSETTAVASREWGSYPILTFPELPTVDVLLMDRQYDAPLGAGELASVPSAAAIVNAVYDATGVRFRELPLTPERVLAGLGWRPPVPYKTSARRRALRAGLGSLLAGLATFASVGLAIKPAMAPIERPDPTAYSAATIEKGRRLSALGGCALCHTAKDGLLYAGGLALQTPFGVVMTTNITPDPTTGIGGWSFPAFERAMREGIHRDGRHLYPAFPYPNFATATEADLQALYAFLMTQPAVMQANTQSRLIFPFNIRPLLAVWNLLFNRPGKVQTEPARSARRIAAAISLKDWSLRRLSLAAQCARRRAQRQLLSFGRHRRRLGRAGADTSIDGAGAVERRRALRLSAHRHRGASRHGIRPDGAGGRRAQATAGRRYPRRGQLSRLVQRRPAQLGSYKACRTHHDVDRCGNAQRQRRAAL